ncbi:MAG: hypothetical protein DRO93_08875 [Candidatus Thorarchaeota archaeon]|nr:MAG: hypothetical protein DRO93_08875 [Candidatus Thorarchaeota archaeon]
MAAVVPNGSSPIHARQTGRNTTLSDRETQCERTLRRYLESGGKWSYGEDRVSIALQIVLALGISVEIIMETVFALMTDPTQTVPTSSMFMRFAVIGVVTLGIMGAMAFYYRDLLLRSRIRGLTRKDVASLLQYLDRLAHGVTTLDAIEGETPPEMKAFQHEIAQRIHLSKLLPDGSSDIIDIYRGAEEADLPTSVMVGCGGLVASIVGLAIIQFVLSLNIPAGIVEAITSTGLVVIGALVLGSVVALLFGYRTYQSQLSTIPDTEPVHEHDQANMVALINKVIDVIRTESLCPIRAFLIGNYPNTLRTGRTLKTTNNVTLHETFIVPVEMETRLTLNVPEFESAEDY